ncbi:MAG: hypothetical protein IKC51_06955 [Myxococcaceae bacterium]|nr:hypothetical protein [Myxococcaceae bacterium]
MQQPFLPADFTLASSTALVGPYGSGKSEIALTLACLMARRLQARPDNRLQVALGDIDVLKPYFRAREAGEALKAMGVRLLAPGGSLKSADLPILTPELGCAAREADTLLVLDVGGDPAGARALGSLRDEVDTNALDLLLVLNRHRPFMESVESVVEQADKIQRASGLRLTGVVSNTHMMAETTLDDVALGLELARRVGGALDVPVRLIGLGRAIATLIERDDLAPSLLQGIPAIVLDSALKPAFLGGCALSPGDP